MMEPHIHYIINPKRGVIRAKAGIQREILMYGSNLE